MKMDNYCGIIKLATKMQFNDVWCDFKTGIAKVYANNFISKQEYAQLYSHIYNCCSIKEPENYENKFITRKSKNKKKNNNVEKCVQLKLYEGFEQFLNDHVINLTENLVCKSEEDLKRYVIQWKNYQCSSRTWNQICKYMNRTWIKRECEENQMKLHEIYVLALTAWKNHPFKKLNKQICTEVLKLIERERKGEVVDGDLISNVINCFIEMGLQNGKAENLKIYQEDFEKLFLLETERFYNQEDTTVSESTSVREYIAKVADKLNEEENRVHRYLHISTKYWLTKLCGKILILNHLDFIQSEFIPWLENEEDYALGRMYFVLTKIPNGLTKVLPLFERHVTSEGLMALEKCCQDALSNPKMYVESILEVYEKYRGLILRQFNNNQNFLTALDRACCSFVNSNPVTKIAGSSIKSVELVVKYWEILLNNSLKLMPSFEDTLNQATYIYKFFQDKDLFLVHYSKLFVKRLVGQQFVNIEMENYIIKKLTEMSASTYTAKLGKMISDYKASEDITKEFRSRLTDSNDPVAIEFTAQVFASNVWPQEQSANIVISLPHEMEVCSTTFNTFYQEKFRGRQLSWLHAMSTAELRTNCYEKSYTLQVGILKMIVLMQYNDGTSWSMEQLAKRTLLKAEVLEQVVNGLIKAKLLSCGEDKNLSSDSLVSLVDDYKNDKLCINLKSTSEKESKGVSQRQIEANRRFQILAAIVRIMKREKTMEHSQLLTEVECKTSFQFCPSYHMIAKCIDTLVDKEYLAKSLDGENCIYSYVP